MVKYFMTKSLSYSIRFIINNQILVINKKDCHINLTFVIVPSNMECLFLKIRVLKIFKKKKKIAWNASIMVRLM